jgi:type IV secretion system protein VirB8
MALNSIIGIRPKSGAPAATERTQTKGKVNEPANDLKVGQWYLEQAKTFEKSKIDSQKRQVVIAWRVGIAGAVFAVIALIGMVSLVVLKRPNPPAVLRVDNSTGKVDVLPTAANGHVTWDQKNDRADLRRYVEARESYDWETVSDFHQEVMVMSDGHEKSLYDTFIRGAQSPLKVLKDQARIIAKVGVITFVGDTAQVFYSRRVVLMNSGMKAPATEYWVATIAYKHVDVPENTDDQDVDPTGFRVTSYTVNRDWSRDPAQTQPAEGNK